MEEHDIEAMPRLRQVIQRVELGNFSMLRFEKLQRGTDCTGLLAAFLDETATRRAARQRLDAKRAARSEEHTSELQSLMRISYAVFCLKKKQKQTYTHISTPYHPY